MFSCGFKCKISYRPDCYESRHERGTIGKMRGRRVYCETRLRSSWLSGGSWTTRDTRRTSGDGVIHWWPDRRVFRFLREMGKGIGNIIGLTTYCAAFRGVFRFCTLPVRTLVYGMFEKTYIYLTWTIRISAKTFLEISESVSDNPFIDQHCCFSINRWSNELVKNYLVSISYRVVRRYVRSVSGLAKYRRRWTEFGP